jgi:hypothetical protein
MDKKESIFHRITDYIETCIEHNLVINPYHSLENWASLVEERKCCPCAKERLLCPCEELMSEIEQNGMCKCTFFQTPIKFIERLKEIYELRIEAQKSKDKKKTKK